MRIIYLHQYFTTPEMAGGTRSFEVGRRLVAAGHTVEMVTSWRDPAGSRHWFTTDVAGMRVHWLPTTYSNHMRYGERIRAFLRFAIGAARRAARLDGDVIFASSTPLTIALPAVYAARRQHIPMVFEVRDLWPEVPAAMGALRHPLMLWAARRLERFAYDNAARVVALSPGMAEGVVRAGYPSAQTSVIPNGADLELFRRDPERGRALRRQLGIGGDKIAVGYTGTLGRVNGVGYLARLAAALQSDARFVFLCVGDGQEREQIAGLARQLGVLGRNFLMASQMPKAEIPAVHSALDIATSLVIPVRELEWNSANKFFDALAAGCCVAINHGGWQADLLREAGAGIQLARDPQQAARELQGLADEPGRVTRSGQNARRLAEQRFSRDELAAQVEAVVVAAVAESSGEAAREQRC